jgi:hypothetical protein
MGGVVIKRRNFSWRTVIRRVRLTECSLPTSRLATLLMRRRGHELITAPSAGFDFNQEISLYRKT